METERYLKIRKELDDIKGMIKDVKNQVQELREGIRGAPNENKELSVREFYKHPWYKYQCEQSISSRNYKQSKGEENSTA